MKKNIQHLTWDSDFFQKRIGKIFIDHNDEFPFDEAQFYDLVYIFSNKENLNFNIVDKKIVYVIEDLQNFVVNTNENIIFFDAISDRFDEILQLSLDSGEYSRFKLDNNFTNAEYEKLYGEWIKKSVTKELATEVIIKKLDSKVLGFTTLTHKDDNLADIGLVAVSKDFRGKGIAKELINQTILLAKKKGYKQIQVVTQLDNIPANILYNNSGFKKQSLTYIYHIWRHDTI